MVAFYIILASQIWHLQRANFDESAISMINPVVLAKKNW